MNELLSRTNASEVPSKDQDFVQVALEDSPKNFNESIAVCQTHYGWGKSEGQAMFVEYCVERFWAPEDALKRYGEVKSALAARGFISDCDTWSTAQGSTKNLMA